MNAHAGEFDETVIASAVSPVDPGALGPFIARAQASAYSFLSPDLAFASLEQLHGLTQTPLHEAALNYDQARARGASAVSINAAAENASPDELSYLSTPDVPNYKTAAPSKNDNGWVKT